MPVEKVHILLECLLLYTNPIVYPKCAGSEIKSIVKLNKLSSVVTVCRHGFHNDVMAPMFQFGGGAIHRIYVAWVVLVKVMFPDLIMKFYTTACLRFLIILGIASQTLQLPEIILRQCCTHNCIHTYTYIYTHKCICGVLERN